MAMKTGPGISGIPLPMLASPQALASPLTTQVAPVLREVSEPETRGRVCAEAAVDAASSSVSARALIVRMRMIPTLPRWQRRNPRAIHVGLTHLTCHVRRLTGTRATATQRRCAGMSQFNGFRRRIHTCAETTRAHPFRRQNLGTETPNQPGL